MARRELPGVPTAPVTYNGEEWRVRALSGAQMEELLRLDGGEQLGGVAALTLVASMCLCEQDGSPAGYTVEELREGVPFAFVKMVGEAALELSGLGEDEEGND